MHMSRKPRGVFISNIISSLENREEQYLFHPQSPDMQVLLNQEVIPLNTPSACPKQYQKLTRIARNTVEPIPSATSYSPFSLGRVKLCSLPDPNILLKNKSNVVRFPYYFFLFF